MKKDNISIICGGVAVGTQGITDILLFSAERAEFVCRTFLENLPTDESERTQDVLEAHRNYCLLETMRKDRACSALLPDWFRAALSDAVGELQEGFQDYVKRHSEDRAARLLTSGAAPTLRGYLQTTMEDWNDR